MRRTSIRWGVSLVVAAAFLAPLLWMLAAAFRETDGIFRGGVAGWLGEPTGWTWDNFAEAWRRAALGRALLNTVVQVAIIAGGGLFVNAMAAFAFARLEFAGRDLLFALVVILVILPVEVLDEFVREGPLTAAEVEAATRRFKKAIIERAMGAELTHHLGYAPGDAPPEATDNHQNGTSGKTVLTDEGPVTVEVPRDRRGTFEPQLIPKHARRAPSPTRS